MRSLRRRVAGEGAHLGEKLEKMRVLERRRAMKAVMAEERRT